MAKEFSYSYVSWRGDACGCQIGVRSQLCNCKWIPLGKIPWAQQITGGVVQTIRSPLEDINTKFVTTLDLGRMIADALKPLEREIIEALMKKEPQKRDDLARTTRNLKKATAALIKSLTILQKFGVLEPAQRGRASQGYRLTKFGREVAALAGITPKK